MGISRQFISHLLVNLPPDSKFKVSSYYQQAR